MQPHGPELYRKQFEFLTPTDVQRLETGERYKGEGIVVIGGARIGDRQYREILGRFPDAVFANRQALYRVTQAAGLLTQVYPPENPEKGYENALRLLGDLSKEALVVPAEIGGEEQYESDQLFVASLFLPMQSRLDGYVRPWRSRYNNVIYEIRKRLGENPLAGMLPDVNKLPAYPSPLSPEFRSSKRP